MARRDWLDSFNKSCDNLKQGIIDEELKKMVESHETAELIDLFSEPINKIANQLQVLERKVDTLATDFKKISAQQPSSTSGGTYQSQTTKPDPRVQALFAASFVHTESVASVAVPAVGDSPRQTNYLKDKQKISKKTKY